MGPALCYAHPRAPAMGVDVMFSIKLANSERTISAPVSGWSGLVSGWALCAERQIPDLILSQGQDVKIGL